MEAPLIFLVIKNNCFNCIKLEVVSLKLFQSLGRRPTKETATETAPLIQNTINTSHAEYMPGAQRVSGERRTNEICASATPPPPSRTHARCEVSRGIIG